MPQTPLDDDTVMALVERALASRPEERESLVRESCGGDARLFDEVWACVREEERMAGFLAEPMVPRPESGAPLKPGDLLEGRFRVLREVAAGGMGVVYEAQDEKLDRRIAIKCALPGFGNRLPPEVRHASEISHPNVCKIHEIHTGQGPQGPFDFLTMEYLEGETLAALLGRGPLEPAQATSIARQICAGLAEAHHRHVVHGDLKSSNIIVTRDEDGALRSVITDFGLARRPGSTQRAGMSGVAGGTPDYMAPELWRGEKASTATDIYALGVILREIAAGQPALGAKWEPIFRRCAAREPTDRFGSAADVERALAPRSRRWMLAVVAAGVLTVATGVVAYRTASAPKEVVRLAWQPVSAPAVMAARGEAITRATAAELAQLRGTARTRFSLSRNGSGATHTLSASLAPKDGTVEVRAAVSDRKAGTQLREWKVVYPSDELRFLPAALAGVVSGAFHLPPVASGATVQVQARSDYEAGMEKLHRNVDAGPALVLLERAARADADSALTQAGRAEAEWLNYQATRLPVWVERARESLLRAQRRNPDLAPVHSVQGLLYAHDGRYEQATDEYRRAIELDPRNADAYRRLGTVYNRNGRKEAALAAFLRAVELAPQRYRNHQALGDYYQQGADYETAARHFRNAVARAPDEPAARYALSAALVNAGHFREAEKELRETLGLRGTPEVLNALAMVLSYQQRDAEAVVVLQQAIKANPGRYLLWMNLGSAYRRLHRKADAQKSWRQALALTDAELRKDARLGYPRACAAYICAVLGDKARAESEIAQARQISPNSSDVAFMAVKTYEESQMRESTLAVLAASPRGVSEDANRHPDLGGLRRDARFRQLLADKQK